MRLTGPDVFIARGKGARLWDVEGREYVDHLLGQGPNLLGHAPEAVIDAVSEACKDGIIFGGQHTLELDAAEAVLRALSWPDMVRFAVTGTEAVQAAIRLARAHTGRTKVVRFEGQYHGWLDNVLTAPRNGQWGVASAGQLKGDLEEFLVIPWNDPDAVNSAFSSEDIAAVITEPAMINAGAIPPLPGYLEHLRAVCDTYQSVLIFDEVITGFRLGLGGGAERFGVTPDLATYGKAMAGGFPVAAFAGRGEIMDRIAIDTNHSGTLNGNTMGSAAVLATLSQLKNGEGYDRIEAHGESLMSQLPAIAAEKGYQLNVHGFPSAFHVGFGDATVTDWRSLQDLDLEGYSRFAETLVENGVWVTGRGVWYTSTAHGSADLSTVLERFSAALESWNPTLSLDSVSG